jgi:lysophospholipase L1-like esterase
MVCALLKATSVAFFSTVFSFVLMAQSSQLILVGDSTTASKNGYGDALCAHFDSTRLACFNHAKNGRSSGSFRAEGLWAEVQKRLAVKDKKSFVFIQFGHNDQPGKPGRSTDLATEFPANLLRYVQEVRAAGGTPVLVTPLTRRSFKNGVHENDLIPWSKAVRQVAEEHQVKLIDLNALSAALVAKLGSDEADTLAEVPKPAGYPQDPTVPKGKFDYTHLGPKGAEVFAGLMRTAIRSEVPELAAFLR